MNKCVNMHQITRYKAFRVAGDKYINAVRRGPKSNILFPTKFKTMKKYTWKSNRRR